jgi:hypothetical protein
MGRARGSHHPRVGVARDLVESAHFQQPEVGCCGVSPVSSPGVGVASGVVASAQCHHPVVGVARGVVLSAITLAGQVGGGVVLLAVHGVVIPTQCQLESSHPTIG